MWEGRFDDFFLSNLSFLDITITACMFGAYQHSLCYQIIAPPLSGSSDRSTTTVCIFRSLYHNYLYDRSTYHQWVYISIVAGELCKLARVTGPEFPHPFSPVGRCLPATGQCRAVRYKRQCLPGFCTMCWKVLVNPYPPEFTCWKVCSSSLSY